MKKTVVFTIADKQNEPYAMMLKNSLAAFHPDLPFVIIDEAKLATQSVPKPDIFYLATPLFAKELFREYECVIKIDADSIVTGNLSHILEDDFYDVGTVLNWNRVDPQRFGEVGFATILPQEYYNNGFVVMRNEDFVNEWLAMCRTIHFPRMPFREQGFLNVLTHYGRFRVRCFDYSSMWHGLVSKGEWGKCVIKNDQLVLPKGEDNYPQEDKIIKVLHWAGGANEAKMNYRVYFSEECSDYLDKLTHGTQT